MGSSNDTHPQVAPQSQKNRPDTIRVKLIGNHLTEEEVRERVSKDFKCAAQIHSLAAYSSKHCCATATFSHKDYDFPIRELGSRRWRMERNQRDFDYDSEFEGITPLYDPGNDKATVELVHRVRRMTMSP